MNDFILGVFVAFYVMVLAIAVIIYVEHHHKRHLLHIRLRKDKGNHNDSCTHS